MSSPIRPTKDLDASLTYVPRAHEKPPVAPVAADEFPIERPSQSLGADAAGPMFGRDLTAHLRHRSSLAPEFPEPKPLEGDRTVVPTAGLRLSRVTAIAALVAWALVSLPGVGQRSGNNNVQGTVRPAAAAIAAAPASSSSTVTQSEKITSRPDDEQASTLIKLGQDFLKSGDFSSARLLLGRAAMAGSAAAALSLGETFDPFFIRRFGVIGVQPGVAKAQEWYQRAAQLGSDAASQHLAKLAQSPAAPAVKREANEE